jgi:hypothetical protein
MIEFDRGRSALLVMHFQNYGVHPEGYWASQSACVLLESLSSARLRSLVGPDDDSLSRCHPAP